MIEDIRITDLGVISEAELTFDKGLTVLTGETGAGKTMVLTALGLLLGDRSDSGAIRSGANQTSVEGRWHLASTNPAIAKAEDAGALVTDGELLLARTVSSDGRSKAVIGGRSVPVGLLSEIGAELVIVHGQADQIRLKSPAAQKTALDKFAGLKHLELLSEYSNFYSAWKQAQATLEDVQLNMSARAKQVAELQEALAELDKLAAKPNEDVELAELAQRLTHSEDLRSAVGLAHDALLNDSFDAVDATSLIGKARKALENAAVHDPALEAKAAVLRQLGEDLNDVAAELSGYLSSLENDSPLTLDQIQERRSALNQALRRWGPTIEDLHAFQESAQAKLSELDFSSERIAILEAEVNNLHNEVQARAEQISSNRSNAAKDLGQRVSQELVALAMGGSKLHVLVEKTDQLGPTGLDSVSFLLESYSGAEPRPLGKGASGGELSRIMLALEVILAETDSTPTFIFDEVDAGVGGAAAIEVGRRLAKLAKNAQVIVVTHLAQVAAFADRHLTVVKTSDAGFTSSDVRVLDDKARAEELARMLSGLSGSETARTHASELRDLAKNS
jgi:DNA repair protein RecN (Recombination protein N)